MKEKKIKWHLQSTVLFTFTFCHTFFIHIQKFDVFRFYEEKNILLKQMVVGTGAPLAHFPSTLNIYIYTYIYTCILCSEYVILLKGSKSLRITSKIEPHVSFYMFSHVSLFSHVSFLTSMNSKGNYFVCVSRI